MMQEIIKPTVTIPIDFIFNEHVKNLFQEELF